MISNDLENLSEKVDELIEEAKINGGKILTKTTVSDLIAKEPITVPPTETIGDLCQLFADKNIGGVPVVKDGNVIGIITERDILNAVKRV